MAGRNIPAGKGPVAERTPAAAATKPRRGRLLSLLRGARAGDGRELPAEASAAAKPRRLDLPTALIWAGIIAAIVLFWIVAATWLVRLLG